MINHIYIAQYCSEDISKIENYELAVNDKQTTWHCHHRAEILPCGRFAVSILKDFGLYYNRPASELIFLKPAEHLRLHNTGEGNVLYGKHMSEETKQKISQAVKKVMADPSVRARMSAAKYGKPSPRKGMHLSEDTKQKLRDANLGKKHSLNTKMKMSASAKGKNTWAKGRHWYNNGIVSVSAYECPAGFKQGRLKTNKE